MLFSRYVRESFECRSKGWWKICWKKKEKLPQENPSYLFSSEKSDLRIGPKNQLEAARRAGDCARFPLSQLPIVVVIRTFWVSWNLPGEQDEDKLGATMVFPLVIKAALCSCCCLEVSRHTTNWGSRLRPRRPTSLLSATESSRLAGNHSGPQAGRRSGGRKWTQTGFSSGLTGQRCKLMQMTELQGRCFLCSKLKRAALSCSGFFSRSSWFRWVLIDLRGARNPGRVSEIGTIANSFGQKTVGFNEEGCQDKSLFSKRN